MNSVLDSVSEWMIAATTEVTGFVASEMTHTTTPQLTSAWFAAQFGPMADLGAALGLLVALLALASAAVRRSPDALAGTLSGIFRAGLGTGLLVALTAIGLAVADEISNTVLASSPHTFWATVAHSWGAHGFGGFGSSALAMLIAMVEVFASLFVWFELIVRNAAIYLAVLFFPVVLAAGDLACPGFLAGSSRTTAVAVRDPQARRDHRARVRRQRGRRGTLLRCRGRQRLCRDDPRRDRHPRSRRVRAMDAHVLARRGRGERIYGRWCPCIRWFCHGWQGGPLGPHDGWSGRRRGLTECSWRSWWGGRWGACWCGARKRWIRRRSGRWRGWRPGWQRTGRFPWRR